MNGKKITMCFLSAAVIGVTAVSIQNCSSSSNTQPNEDSSSSETQSSIDKSSSSLGTQPPSGASSSSLGTQPSSGASSSSLEAELSSDAGSSSSSEAELLSSGVGSSSSRSGSSSSAGSSSSSSRLSSSSAGSSSSSSRLSSSSARSSSSQVPDDGKPIVYMTTKITPEGLMAVYEALGLEATGKVAVKISTGEPANRKYFLNPNLIKNLVQRVSGTIVESNTAYGGSRASTAAHKQVAKDHGFTDIATVVIMDENGSDSIPVTGTGTKHLKGWDYVGKAFKDYNFHIVLSHFKGHQMGGFGGALKNMSIGYASSMGKAWIHSAGTSRTSPFGGSNTQDSFLESMAEAAKAVADWNKGKILYINVMNNLSVDCDCMSTIAEPTMKDIGILASLDPVALDKACLDLVDNAPDGRDLIQRIDSKNGRLTVTHAERIGLGSRDYKRIQLAEP